MKLALFKKESSAATLPTLNLDRSSSDLNPVVNRYDSKATIKQLILELYRSPDRSSRIHEAQQKMTKLFANSGQAGRKIKRLLNDRLLPTSESAGSLPAL